MRKGATVAEYSIPNCFRCGDPVASCTCKQDFAVPVVCVSEDLYDKFVDVTRRLVEWKENNLMEDINDIIDDATTLWDEVRKGGDGEASV